MRGEPKKIAIHVSLDELRLLLHTLGMYRQLVDRDTSGRPSLRAMQLSAVDLLAQTLAAAVPK